MIDLIMRRSPHFETASELFDLSINKNIQLYSSSHIIATVHYVCKKNIPETALRFIIEDLLHIISIIPVDVEILKKSLKSHHKDFEDAIQIFCAHQIKNLDGIITRNLRDFFTSEIAVFAPDEALEFIKENTKN